MIRKYSTTADASIEGSDEAIENLEREYGDGADYISRKAVKEVLTKEWTKYMPIESDVNLSFVLDKINGLPSVFPQLPRMKEINCPYDLNQFLLGEPIFENTFPEEDCEQRKFYGDCYHCFSTAIASRDHQLNDDVIKKINAIVTEWNADTWTDNFSYECMCKIADILAEKGE